VSNAETLHDFACSIYNSHTSCLSSCDQKVRDMIAANAAKSATCTKRGGAAAKLNVDPFGPEQSLPFEAGRTTTEAAGRSGSSSSADSTVTGAGTVADVGRASENSSGEEEEGLSDEVVTAAVDSWMANLELDEVEAVTAFDSAAEGAAVAGADAEPAGGDGAAEAQQMTTMLDLSRDQEGSSCARKCYAVSDKVTDSFCQNECSLYVEMVPHLCTPGCGL
jgi:hypothetical protein